ncbi:hypothetical protein CCAX7_003340 [Capsulimonas corticalis]|uniref:Uncharacterized protein n=1 Tax=Capsulimonas corticalis TaxID=2219043 RepID=A0A402CS77_9BACT|nr:multicopper oxidase domain-containing protein [Capsulimonas corticalis]BDI28283.1 hypothetical protein CCAX7_003340 [Capsulimonas corticalis]
MDRRTALTQTNSGLPPVSRRSVLRGAMAGGTALALGAFVPSATAAQAAPRAIGTIREYWIQAGSFPRTLVSGGHDDLLGRIFTPEDSGYWALGYRAYTPNWAKPLASDANHGENAGIPGPVIRANVGDTIVIHFRNNDTHYRFPHSIHVHGLVYTPENDGAWISSKSNAPGTAVLPGHTHTYTYRADATSVGTWVYHDHSLPQSLGGGAPVMDLSTQLGMFGLIAVDAPGAPPVDCEHILYFHQMYAADVPSLAQDYACFNGAAFLPNTPVFHSKVGERVRWRIGALGQEFYTFHLHGHRWKTGDGYRDTALIGPASTATIEYVEDNPGSWFYHATSTNHLVSGMIGQYFVTKA